MKIGETIEFEADEMDPGLLSRLQDLRERLAPREFLGRVRAYVLTEAHRFADLAYWEDSETDQVAEQAHQASSTRPNAWAGRSRPTRPRPMAPGPTWSGPRGTKPSPSVRAWARHSRTCPRPGET